MIVPIGLAESGSGRRATRHLPYPSLASVYGGASARLRPSGVVVAPQQGLSGGRKAMEYPANNLVLMAKRRGEGSP
jgi:hypothetical protein